MRLFILYLMIFLHIVNDYNIQGWLASAKQKTWWRNNAPQDIYKNDYLMALFEHAFSWAFMIELPIFVYTIVNDRYFITEFTICVLNTILHAYIDDLKANKFKINLVQDQALHFAQIIVTWILFLILAK